MNRARLVTAPGYEALSRLMVQKARWPILLLLAVALVAVLTACGKKVAEVKLSDTPTGTHVLLHPGEVFGVTLKGATWTFNPVSDPSILAEVPSQAGTSHPIVDCAPELGCGVTNAWYMALAPGTAVISATQGSCIEQPTCVGNQGIYQVTVVVIA
jgi:hypothetical protein